MTLRKKAVAAGSAATLLSGSAGALLLALAASPAGAVPTTITVDTLSDGAPNSSDCLTPVANSCSLRDALGAVTDDDTIVFASGLTGTINLDAGEGELEIGSDIVLQGPGADLLTVDAGGNSRVFYVCGGPDTEISGLTITGGSAAQGGGLYDECGNGTTLRSVVVTGNQATSNGGGLYSNGSITIIDSVISNNSADSTGGGLEVSGDLIMSGSVVSGNSSYCGGGARVSGDITISYSTFDMNQSAFTGGGLCSVANGGSITITGSTFSNNVANGHGGGIEIEGTSNTVLIANTTITGNGAVSGGGVHAGAYNDLTLAQDTIVGNSATSNDALYSGGGVHVVTYLGSLTLSGTIVSGNSAASGPADIGFGNAQYAVNSPMNADDSLLGDVDSRLTVNGSGNILSTDPGVAALANNGGPTKTMALLTTSAALDAGPTTVFTFPGNANDQRGEGFPRIVGTKADIGAFEYEAPAPTPTTATDGTVVPAFTG